MENAQKNFVEIFSDTLTQLEHDARAAGSNMTEVCREAHISRTTPDRWKLNPPATIRLVGRMQQIVAAKTAARAAPVDTDPAAPAAE